MEYIIKNKNLEIKISSLGAQIVSVKYKGKERSWQNENGKWSDHAPILFPICGRVKTFFEGEQYAMPCHGMAYTSEFTLFKKKSNSISMCFCSDKSTLKVYPFNFKFEVRYTLILNEIKIDYFIYNQCDKVMPYGAGAHDSFVVDGNIEDCYIKFNRKEKLEVLDEDGGYLLRTKTKLPEGKILKIKNTDLKNNHSLVFENINSRKLSLISGNHKKIVSIGFKKYQDLVLWRCENTDMICLEPWLNIPDGMDEEQREFTSINGLRHIKPFTKDHLIRTIKYY